MTIVWQDAMPAMPGIPMPGGWILSPAWLPMCGQTWFGAGTAFLIMWAVMMGQMMLPSLLPVLWRDRQAASRTGEMRLGWLAAGYFFVWALVGAGIFPLGATLAIAETNLPALARAVPMAVGLIVLIAGALQFTTWKARHLACCRALPIRGRTPPSAVTAWQRGMRLGLHCGHCSAGLTSVLLVTGMMNPWTMTAITVAITAERLAQAGDRVARAIGIVVIMAGMLLIARAAGFA
jgi:predicted metal-binding membrane protein